MFGGLRIPKAISHMFPEALVTEVLQMRLIEFC